MSDVLTSYHKSVINRAITRYGVEIEIRRTRTNTYGEPVGDISDSVFTGKALLSYSSQPILAGLTEGATLTTKKNPQLLLHYADGRCCESWSDLLQRNWCRPCIQSKGFYSGNVRK